jgi:hypothetical protein
MMASASFITKSTVESISAYVSHVNDPWFWRAKKNEVRIPSPPSNDHGEGSLEPY